MPISQKLHSATAFCWRPPTVLLRARACPVSTASGRKDPHARLGLSVGLVRTLRTGNGATYRPPAPADRTSENVRAGRSAAGGSASARRLHTTPDCDGDLSLFKPLRSNRRLTVDEAQRFDGTFAGTLKAAALHGAKRHLLAHASARRGIAAFVAAVIAPFPWPNPMAQLGLAVPSAAFDGAVC
jgi:hypothetical protein